MQTPIADFVKEYTNKNGSRFHMPGHKGQAFLGCEPFDITEIAGADSLYEADGIIAESEKNATMLFGTGRTFFSTEGSSQCIRAMLYLAVSHWREQYGQARPYVIAARNVHKAFLYAAALIDFDVVWLYPEEMHSLCSCQISPGQLEEELKNQLQSHDMPPAAVYVTSPDYLGGQLSIDKLAKICHKYNTILAVDNAHGAYLHFLEKKLHPIDLGADICCDSAHKTLPVLTGGAYLQISKQAPASFAAHARHALSLFGSTSPSYLILSSLDLCNAYLSDNYEAKLAKTVGQIEAVRNTLRKNGWNVKETDPLKVTVQLSCGIKNEHSKSTATADSHRLTGSQLADILRLSSIECEYADSEYIVFMMTPENTEEDYKCLIAAFGIYENGRHLTAISGIPKNVGHLTAASDMDKEESNNSTDTEKFLLKPAKCTRKLTIHEAIFSPHELLPVKEASGRICGTPTVGCPPAIPIVVSGEIIDENAIGLFEHYGITEVDVVKLAK